jgi:hypothetical protein
MKRSFHALAFLTFLTLLAAPLAHALTPAPLWSQRFGGAGLDEGNSVVVDGSGNIFVTGRFAGTINLGGSDLLSAGNDDIFLAKYNSSGVHQWSQRFGSVLADFGASVAVDGAGSVYMTGYFRGNAYLGGGDLLSAGENDIFLAKYNASGVHQWSKRFGGASFDEAYSLAVDAAGNVFLTGGFTGTVDFGGGNLISGGGADIVLARYNSNGVHQWSQRFGSAAALPDLGWSVALDGSGNVFATGYFQGTVDFGGGNLVSAGSTDIYLAKYNASGTHQWSRQFGSTNIDIGYAVAVDGSGNVAATGQFQGTVDFGGGNLVSAGGTDIFLVKYNPNGVFRWSQSFGDTGTDIGYSVAVDGSGSTLVTGLMSGTVNLGGSDLASAGGNDIFLAKHSTDGAHLWSQRYGSTGEDNGNEVATDASGNVHLTGRFQNAVSFGAGTLTSAGSYDMFLAKYSGTTAEPIITSVTDIGNDQGRKVNIRFTRSGTDDTGASLPVTRYVAFRRVDDPPAASMAREPAGPSERKLMADGWTQVGFVDAFTEGIYHIDVPTIGDSTEALGQYHSVFYIRAATDAPGIFFDSAPDSGWSLDNLAPGIPGSLLYGAGQLSWNESPAEDFDFFTVYGSNTDAFGSSIVVDYTVAPDMDVTASPYTYYFVTATDFSGNEGKPAKINTLTGVGGTPRSYVLSVSNFPNPFNPRTTVSYTVPSRGAVTVAVYDARGARVATLVEGENRDAGAYRVEWNGRTDAGLAAPSGVYFARIVHAGDTRSRKLLLLK